MDGMEIYFNEKTQKWEPYNDQFDITIHCETYEEQQTAMKALKNVNVILKVKEEISRQLHLPRYEHETENFDDGLKFINDFIDNLLNN